MSRPLEEELTESCKQEDLGVTLVTVAAATATMATLTKRDTIKETALSTVLYISARRAGPSPGGGLAPRVSTLPECRYRLCGITTAPSSDTAM